MRLAIVTLFILIVQVGLPCVFVLFFLEPLVFRITKWEKTSRNRRAVILVSLALIFGGMVFWAHHPIISCPPEYREAFTPEKREKAVEFSNLNGNLLFPVKITVLKVGETGGVTIETLYGFLGNTIELVYD